MKLDKPMWLVMTDFGPDIGVGMKNDPTPDWSVAVTEFMEARGDGQPARVFRIEFENGHVEECTEGAITVAVQRCNARLDGLPDWLAEEARGAA